MKKDLFYPLTLISWELYRTLLCISYWPELQGRLRIAGLHSEPPGAFHLKKKMVLLLKRNKNVSIGEPLAVFSRRLLHPCW